MDTNKTCGGLFVKKLVILFLIAALTIIVCAVPASAVTVFYLSDTRSATALEEADKEAIEAIDFDYGTTLTGTEAKCCLFLSYDGETSASGSSAYYFNRAFYKELSNHDKKLVMKTFTEYMKNTPNVKAADLQKISNALNEVNDKYITQAISDMLNSSGEGMLSAVVTLKPILTPISTFLGIVAILMCLMMVVTTVVDIIYISLPFADKTKGEKPKFMSRDAYKALQECVDGSTSQVYVKYFKKRFLTYMLTIMCVVYLVVGGFGELFGNIIDLFSGIF